MKRNAWTTPLLGAVALLGAYWACEGETRSAAAEDQSATGRLSFLQRELEGAKAALEELLARKEEVSARLEALLSGDVGKAAVVKGGKALDLAFELAEELKEAAGSNGIAARLEAVRSVGVPTHPDDTLLLEVHDARVFAVAELEKLESFVVKLAAVEAETADVPRPLVEGATRTLRDAVAEVRRTRAAEVLEESRKIREKLREENKGELLSEFERHERESWRVELERVRSENDLKLEGERKKVAELEATLARARGEIEVLKRAAEAKTRGDTKEALDGVEIAALKRDTELDIRKKEELLSVTLDAGERTRALEDRERRAKAMAPELLEKLAVLSCPGHSLPAANGHFGQARKLVPGLAAAPHSLSRLQAIGALEATDNGLLLFGRVCSDPRDSRPRMAGWKACDSAKKLSLPQFKEVQRQFAELQEIVRNYGEIYVEEGILAP